MILSRACAVGVGVAIGGDPTKLTCVPRWGDRPTRSTPPSIFTDLTSIGDRMREIQAEEGPVSPLEPGLRKRIRARWDKDRRAPEMWLGPIPSMPKTCLNRAGQPARLRRGREWDEGGIMIQPRAADDFAAVRARMEELRRERAGIVSGGEPNLRMVPRPYATSNQTRLTDKPKMPPPIRRLLSRYC